MRASGLHWLLPGNGEPRKRPACTAKATPGRDTQAARATRSRAWRPGSGLRLQSDPANSNRTPVWRTRFRVQDPPRSPRPGRNPPRTRAARAQGARDAAARRNTRFERSVRSVVSPEQARRDAREPASKDRASRGPRDRDREVVVQEPGDGGDRSERIAAAKGSVPLGLAARLSAAPWAARPTKRAVRKDRARTQRNPLRRHAANRPACYGGNAVAGIARERDAQRGPMVAVPCRGRAIVDRTSPRNRKEPGRRLRRPDRHGLSARGGEPERRERVWKKTGRAGKETRVGRRVKPTLDETTAMVSTEPRLHLGVSAKAGDAGIRRGRSSRSRPGDPALCIISIPKASFGFETDAAPNRSSQALRAPQPPGAASLAPRHLSSRTPPARDEGRRPAPTTRFPKLPRASKARG